MWWNILPPFFIIAAAVALPQFIAPLNNWLLVGNFYRRSLLDRDLTKQYLRDTRLTGNPYILTDLEDVPEDDEEEELTEEQLADAEHDKCKTLVEEKELQEALDRSTKCPKPEIEEDEQETCKRRDGLKKKRLHKKAKAMAVAEKGDKKEQCKSEETKQELCNVGPVCPPCDKPGEKDKHDDGGVEQVNRETETHDDKKCRKKNHASRNHKVGAEKVQDKQSNDDNPIVVTDSGTKKCKPNGGDAVGGHAPGATGDDHEQKMCPKKQ